MNDTSAPVEIHGTSDSAWRYRGHVIRHITMNVWQVRRDNGTGWGNGDLVNTVRTKRRAIELIDSLSA